MTTEARLQELRTINKNIVIESEKLVQYLQIVKEKTNNAITFLSTLDATNILRRFSATYEYLNTFYIKLVEQNCSFELFFLEHNELGSVTEMLSNRNSIKDMSINLKASNVENTDSQKLSKLDIPEIYSNKSNSVQQTSNTSNSCLDDISYKSINTPTKNESKLKVPSKRMNIYAKEFSPRQPYKTEQFTNSKITLNDSSSVKNEISSGNYFKNISETKSNDTKTFIMQHESVVIKDDNISKEKVDLSTFQSDTSKTDSKSSKDTITLTSKPKDNCTNLCSIMLEEQNLIYLNEDKNNTGNNSNLINDYFVENVSTQSNISSKFISELAVNKVKEEYTTEHNLNFINNVEKHDEINLISDSTIQQGSTNLQNENCLEQSALKESKVDNEKKEIIDLIDVKSILKKIKNKAEDKYSVIIPDLRPYAIGKEKSSDSTSSHSTTTICKKLPKRKTNKNNKICYSKDDCIHENIIAKRGPIPKEGELCYISYVESPSSFYVHIIRDENTFIDSLSLQIAEISEGLKSFTNKKHARNFIKMYCVCYIKSYSMWCRVAVTNWMMDHDQIVEVRLIDYGLSCKVPLENIRAGSQYFFTLPAMADRCELAWVKPLHNSSTWSAENIAYFNKILNTTDKLFTISFIEEERDYFLIDLQNDQIESVAGLMISEDQAQKIESEVTRNWANKFMKNQVVKSQGFNINEFGASEFEKLQECMLNDSDEEEITDPHLAVSHYKSKDETNICQLFLRRGYCFKGDNCSFSHKPLNPDGWTTDREAVYYDAFNQLELPLPGSEICLKIVNVIDLRTFYAVVKNLPCSNLIGMPVNTIRMLVQLMNDPEEAKNHKPLIVIPALGEIILVNHNNQWQRGRVFGMEEFADKVELEVFLVDFGETKKFNMKNCRCISEKHLQVPFQVVMCTLYNVVLNEDISASQIQMGLDYLEIKIQNNKLKARNMYTSNFLSVQLFTEDGDDVGEELIKAGIVNRNTTEYVDAKSILLVD